MLTFEHSRRCSSSMRRSSAVWSVAVWLVAALGCGPSIEEEPPIPEHRIESCEIWCGMMLDPVCPAQEVEVETQDECVDGCGRNEVPWGDAGEGEDACATTFIPYVDCLAMLSCDELQQHFIRASQGVAYEERSSCGELMEAQQECQLPYQ